VRVDAARPREIVRREESDAHDLAPFHGG
jgi:hypothetical protein